MEKNRQESINVKPHSSENITEGVAFSDITEEFCKDHKLDLKSGECRSGRINHGMTWLNRLIYIAVDREVIRFNPIADVRYDNVT